MFIAPNVNLIDLFLSETAAPANPESTLPVTFDTLEDPNLTNLTRNDANCDKTGTCYDGKEIF